jgi:RNase H-fold protein (predicted Holliday junction resolvase)
MFDYLCIDWGSHRVGLAYGSSQTKLILPYNQVLENHECIAIILDLLVQKKIEYIILGRPTTFKGDKTRVTSEIELFKTELEQKLFAKSIPGTIIFYDERNSTKFAKSVTPFEISKDSINHLAAARILDNYFTFVLKIEHNR